MILSPKDKTIFNASSPKNAVTVSGSFQKHVMGPLGLAFFMVDGDW